MLQFIYDNVQWIFSGIGVVALTTIIGLIFKKAKKTDRSILVKKSERVHVKDNENERVNISKSKDIIVEGNKNAQG